MAGWFESTSGGFGLNEQLGSDIKSLLSTQKIRSHVTTICIGAVPSIKSTELKMGVERFDPKASTEAIAVLGNGNIAEKNSISKSAEAAKNGQKMLVMKSNDIKASLSALGTINDGKNKVLDTNSMMTALDDYLQKFAAGQAGVPINYYLKAISKDMLIEMWMAKYSPRDTMALQLDDSKGKAIAAGNGKDTTPVQKDTTEPVNTTPDNPSGNSDSVWTMEEKHDKLQIRTT